jgi:hypothetical protein
MNILTYIALIITITLLSIIPIIKGFLERFNVDVNDKRFELLRKITADAVAHVNQIALTEELGSTQKKDLAIGIAAKLATSFGIPENQQQPIAELIESVLWNEEDLDSTDDDDDFE